MDYIEVEHLEETKGYVRLLSPGKYSLKFNKIKDENEKNGQPPLVKIQGIALTIQNALGYVASQLESLLNVFNFSTPLISWLAAFMFLGSAIVLYFIPFRILLLLYGVHKFTKRLRNPDKEDNVEILDFLRHVPDSQELRDFCESDTISKTERKRKATLHRNVEKDSYVI